MKNKLCFTAMLLPFLLILSGCAGIGDKSSSISSIYGATALIALFLLIGYCCLIPKRGIWFLLLFSSVLVVNIGYFTLSVSKTLEEALLANRIAYFGSVFLPFSMLMIILEVTKTTVKRWLPSALLAVAMVVFLIASSPGYLNIYYQEVALEITPIGSVLRKTYGSWHGIYLCYLLGYFAAMVGVTCFAIRKGKMVTTFHAVILTVAVFGNIGVWLIEQLISIDFEILSVSYIFTELFLLILALLIGERDKDSEQINYDESAAAAREDLLCDYVDAASAIPETENVAVDETKDQHQHFLWGVQDLTQTERTVYEFYIQGKTTKEIMAELNIKENTLKFHNKNIYSKLGVTSRKQLIEIYRQIEAKSE